MAELVHRGLAHPIDWTAAGQPTRWRITPEGHAMLGRLMRENGLEAQISGAADWHQPEGRHLPSLEELRG